MASKLSLKELIEQGLSLEKEGKFKEAIQSYSAAIKRAPTYSAAYNRLMILFRRQKEYNKEIDLINQALQSYEQEIVNDRQQWEKDHSGSADISLKLAKSMGLINEKGLPVHEDPQVLAWRKRLETAQKKLVCQNNTTKKRSAKAK